MSKAQKLLKGDECKEMKTIELSGMGTEYETACQVMLMRGINYLKKHPEFDFKAYQSAPNIYGICMSTSSDAEKLDKFITRGVHPSGAQHQCVIGHLAYIHKHGYDKWIEDASKSDPNRVREQLSLKELEKNLRADLAAWKAKLDSGYNPLSEILSKLPEGHIIHVDTKDPKSVDKAVEKLVKTITEGENK